MPQIYIAKYNRFVDSVLNRINRLLGKEYDPVRVKLLSQVQRDNAKGKKKSAGKDRKKSEKTNKMGELQLSRSASASEPEFILISKTGNSDQVPENQKQIITEVRATPIRQNNKKKGSSPKKPSANKNKITIKNGNKTKQTANKNKQKAKATLFGLSSLKRDGDVQVNMLSDHTTVKTNFVLGPLTLRVEREMAKSGKRELRSATATTAEMYGRLNLRLIPGGVATLHSIRVLQPKQVRIDTTDNHDKTTEFMWKRSPQIASIVSQKLGAVTRSLLKPAPQPRP